MKRLLYTLTFLLALSAGAQQFPAAKNSSLRRPATDKPLFMLGFGYNLAAPVGAFRQGMTAAHGVETSAGIALPGTNHKLVTGIYLGYGVYGMERYGIQYRQGNNFIDTRIQYTSSLSQAGAFGQYLFSVRHRLQPFVSARLGWVQLSSNFYVADPTDPLACRSLAAETVISDNSWLWGYGGGLRIGVNKGERQTNFIELSVNQTRGSTMDYVNVGRLMPQSAPMDPSEGAKPVRIDFVNVANGNVHQHNIAELFRHRFSAVQARIAWVWDLQLGR